MPFRPEHLKNNYELVTGHRIPKKIVNYLDKYKTTKSQRMRARLVLAIMDDLNKEDKEVTSKIMNNCGGQCISSSIIRKAKAIYSHSDDINKFLDQLNLNRIGGGRLIYREGVITGGYDRCYCGSVNQTTQNIPIEYCHCSAGWYKRLFEDILGKEICVEITNSIVSGSTSCDFIITI